MDFDLADIRPALQVQVVAGMYFDRRVFLVANTGERRPIVIALTPHQARSIAGDLTDQSGIGEVRDRHRPVQPAVVAVPIPKSSMRRTPES